MIGYGIVWSPIRFSIYDRRRAETVLRQQQRQLVHCDFGRDGDDGGCHYVALHHGFLKIW
jgi:hypothetical protein